MKNLDFDEWIKEGCNKASQIIDKIKDDTTNDNQINHLKKA